MMTHRRRAGAQEKILQQTLQKKRLLEKNPP